MFKRGVLTKYKIQADRELTPLEKALKFWVETGNEKRLVELYKKKPSLFPRETAATADMYRGIVIPRKAMQALIDGGEPIKKEGFFESWTTDEQVAEEFMRTNEGPFEGPDFVAVMLKKKPTKVLLAVCDHLTDEDFDLAAYCSEDEFLTLAEPHSLKDVHYAYGSKPGDILYTDSESTREWLKKHPPMRWRWNKKGKGI